MGREFHEHNSDHHGVELEEGYDHPGPGCMGAIFSVLDYHHHWYNVKNMFPHRKYNRGRQHAKCCGNPQTISMEREPVETQGLLDGEANHFQVQFQQQTKKTGSTNKSSGTTKRLSGKGKTKEDNHKHWILGLSDRPKLHQTGWMNPIILVRKRSSKKPDIHDKELESSEKHGVFKNKFNRTLMNQKPMSQKHHNKEVSYDHQVKEGVDVLEIFKVNKDLFLDILQDPEVGISQQYFPGNQTSKTVKLVKSGSFPGSPQTRYLRSSTLEHKQNEFWSFRKAEKSVPQGSDSQRWNHLVMNRFKDIKQRIKQGLKEKRKSSINQMTMADSISNSNGGVLNRISRTKSINESLDRYTQLFENSVSKVGGLHHSKSLKLTTEDKGRVPKFFRRISSLSDLDSFCSLLHEVSRDAFSSEMSIRSILNYDANKEIGAHDKPKSISFPQGMDKFELVEAVLEAELQEKITGGNNRSSTKQCDVDEDIVQLEMEITSAHQEQEESVFVVKPIRELIQPTSDSSDLTSRAEHPIPEEVAESFTCLKDRRTTSHGSVEYEAMGISSRFLFFESDRNHADDPCYNYVKDILELSGFIQTEQLQTWYSADQPLNPSLFKELEILLHPELESCIEEVGSCNNCDHQLVFDLVNEALLEISEKSSIYFPKPFSFNCCMTQLLKGNNNVVQEVWTKVSRNIGFQPESDQSLDDIIARDLAKDAWLNLQAESEFVALELEDLIFDELLDELLC